MSEPMSENKIPPPSKQFEGPCRMTGVALIQDLIKRHRQKADWLETILKMLPEDISHEQDEALWQIACDLKRP